jgi:hypothetical protein
LIENFDLFSCEFAVGNFKMLAIWEFVYTREARFPTKRLLFMNKLLAKY